MRGAALGLLLSAVSCSTAAAQAFADSCKDILAVGALNATMRSDSAIDIVELSLYAASSSKSKSDNVAGSYGGYGGSFSGSSSRSAAVSRSNFRALSAYQLSDASLSKGDPEAIRAWRDCKLERRGPSIVLQANDDRNLALDLSWDRPRFIEASGASLLENVSIQGARAVSGVNCLVAGYLITDAGCTVALVRDNPKEPVVVRVNTTLGPLRAYAQAATRFRFVTQPYPATAPGRAAPPYTGKPRLNEPFLATAYQPPNGQDGGGGTDVPMTFTMDDGLAKEGWVFVDTIPTPSVTGTGHAGGCGNAFKDAQVTEYTISGKLRATSRRGDTGYSCHVSLVPSIVRLEEQ